jgi:hypothetical protein
MIFDPMIFAVLDLLMLPVNHDICCVGVMYS